MVTEAGGPSLIDRLARVADVLMTRLAATPGAEPLPTPDWAARAATEGSLQRPVTWRNTLFHTPQFRRAHVEFFAIAGDIGVVHLCAFPPLDLALPILGFDIIAGREKATGCFLDLSPTVPEAAEVTAAWARARGTLPGESRALPGWAAVFSPKAIALRPRNATEVEAGLALGLAALEALLTVPRVRGCDPNQMRAAQRRYIEAQRENQHTRRMLASCVGAGLADRFIAECLFPEPPPAALAA